MSPLKYAAPLLVAGVLLLGLLGVASQWFGSGSTGAVVAVKLPKLSSVAARGKVAFDDNCAACHGANAAGTDKGPPLVHDIYNPGHHSDAAFYRAARSGVPQHHWPFGNMPVRPDVSDGELADIVRYVRELQVANGIFYREHRM